MEKVWFNHPFKQCEYEGWLKVKYKYSSYDDNSYQLQLNSFSKLYVFNSTYFSQYTRSQHGADKHQRKVIM